MVDSELNTQMTNDFDELEKEDHSRSHVNFSKQNLRIQSQPRIEP